MRVAPFVLFALPCVVSAQSPATGVVGVWQEPGHSVLAVEHCGADVCARILVLSKDAPHTTDVHNPDAGLRSRPLCGLTIGTGFHLTDADHAEGGRLYDPKSGKTYSGTMTADGNTLRLRGYLGIKAFGRTESWQRISATPQPCR